MPSILVKDRRGLNQGPSASLAEASPLEPNADQFHVPRSTKKLKNVNFVLKSLQIIIFINVYTCWHAVSPTQSGNIGSLGVETHCQDICHSSVFKNLFILQVVFMISQATEEWNLPQSNRNIWKCIRANVCDHDWKHIKQRTRLLHRPKPR